MLLLTHPLVGLLMFTLSDAELQPQMAFNKKYAGLPDLVSITALH